MGLIARLAVRRVHVLVVPVPGRPLLRMRAEAAVRARGWVLATTPADADALLVCGRTGAELGEVVDRIWDQLPVPRARVEVASADELVPALDGVRRRLLDEPVQRAEARGAAPAAAAPEAMGHEHAEHEHAHHEHDMHEHDMHEQHGHEMHQPEVNGHEVNGHEVNEHEMPMGHDHEMHGHEMHGHEMHGHEMHGHEMHGHEMHGHDMHGMSMTGPAGIPLAEGSTADRDDLEMDVLHLPLGPVLPDWPAGLLIELTLSGDVVLEATARLLEAASGEPAEEDPLPPDAVALLGAADRAARLLRLAGWGAPALTLDAVRDRVLANEPLAGQVAALRRCLGRVRRSASLQWSVGPDVRGRLLAAVGEALGAADGRPAATGPLEPAALPALLAGRGLADVRLLVAGAGSDPVPSPAGAHHG